MKTSRRLPKVNNTKDIILPSTGINPRILDEDVNIYEGVQGDGDKYIWKIDKETGDWVVEMLDSNDLPLVTLPTKALDESIPQYKRGRGTDKKK